jgi:hypothetical protein
VILDLFFIFIILAVALIVIGFAFKVHVTALLGFMIFFILGVITFGGQLQYGTGDVINISSNSTYVTRTITYANFNSTSCNISQLGLGCDNLTGVFLAIISVLGFILTFVQSGWLTGKKGEDEV